MISQNNNALELEKKTNLKNRQIRKIKKKCKIISVEPRKKILKPKAAIEIKVSSERSCTFFVLNENNKLSKVMGTKWRSSIIHYIY